MLRQYIQHFSLVGKLETHNVKTLAELFSLAHKCSKEAEAQSCTERRNAPEEAASLERNQPGNKKNKRKAIAALATDGCNNPP
jgi:hypothetical protein